MSASRAEREIREAVVARLRALMPDARIVHELNVGGMGTNRIDVAAVGRQAIVAVEIKSERDTLTRLAEQWAAFSECCHLVIVVAHERHFRECRDEHMRADLAGPLRLNHTDFFKCYLYDRAVWRYPRPAECRWDRTSWTFDPVRDLQRQPRAAALLGMLWAEELRAECSRNAVPISARAARPAMISAMAWNMTGRQVCEAVCRQIRARNFAEADAPIQVAA